ncbi:tRNA (34-2'-O)-methyltransferase regulator WDR6 [Musca vetustissima]|uniref:tRNA (34-2'-O)-methyltransferase regulator WDR6 n=1 Tax=Musca vetustissima TaxID=27455 RepID=UPI002AB74BCB|nr:tRNA (34-2'-O)-methyltransferase regulator WDR6 [Musca vetustissima]
MGGGGGQAIETLADAIAIEILNENAIVTGKGDELHLFTKTGEEIEQWQEQVLDIKLTNKVHGIHKNSDGSLLVYGEKEFVLLSISSNGGGLEFQEFFRATLSDWISCGCFLAESNEVILLTAHSIILRLDYDVSKRSCVLAERISCSDKSTLYCAHLYGDTWQDLVVFSGNAFGELLIWQPSRNEENPGGASKPKCSALLHRISAHNGVIFSIDYDRDTQQLITTSDDRAVKWWKVKMADENGGGWLDSKLQPVASGYGHVARVFRGRIIKDGSNVYALSVGEDSYFCLWRNNGELLFKRRQQFGATIWNFIYSPSNKTIYTLGSIGNMVAYDLSYELQRLQNSSEDMHLLAEVSKDKPSEYIAKVKFLRDHHILLGITNENRIMELLYEKDAKAGVQGSWKELDVGLNFKCTVMEVYGNRVAICGFKRVLLLECKEELKNEDERHWKFEVMQDQSLLQGVIRAFVFFDSRNYLICDDKGNCELQLEDSKRTLLLAKCKEPWLTTALLLSRGDYLLISNRLGNLLLYKLKVNGESYDLCDTLKHPHGNLGATQLQLLNEGGDSALIRSCGHDGAIKLYNINYKESNITSCSREVVQVSWIEAIIGNWYDGCDLFLGFNDNHFTVWTREYDFLLQLACGGGHRCWHFSIHPETQIISLVFIKNKRVRFYQLPLLNKGLTSLPPAKKWHIAPCNIMEILKVNQTSIAVTAGDDNLIKIHKITPKGLQQCQELHCHISNIRALKLHAINEEEFLIFSGGGRAQLCINRIDIKNNYHIQELLNYTVKPADQPSNSTSSSTNNKSQYNFDPETRLMSLDIKQVNHGEYQIFIGCSDGHIRSLDVHLNPLQINTTSQYFYQKCLLQIKYLKEYDYLLAAATDGYLRFFDSELTKCLHQINHHSSGVNGLALRFEPLHKSLQILSGGDDQAITFSSLKLAEDFKSTNKFTNPSLHTAQVCAAAISADGHYGYTSGVDQMLYKIDLKTGEIVDQFHSCVADIKGVCLLDNDLCILYGCGMQLIKLSN